MRNTKISSKLISLLLISVILLSLCACGNKQDSTELVSMGTSVTITAYGKEAETAISSATSIFNAMNGMLNVNDSTSIITQINNAKGSSVVIPGQVYDMIEEAKIIYDQSGGSLDLTIQPIIDLWGFNGGQYNKPTEWELLDTVEYLCFDKVNTQYFPDSGSYTVQLPDYGKMTFNSVARGCATENAIVAMKNAGADSGIVSMPGMIGTFGEKPDKELWNIAIANPDDTSSYLGYLTLGEGYVSTTMASTEEFTFANGVKYNHIITPSTGYPAISEVKSITVVSSGGTQADGLSTAMFVLGQDKALKYWRNYKDFDMIIVTENNQIYCTSGLTEAFKLSDSSYNLNYIE